jgi:hypothetical protein
MKRPSYFQELTRTPLRRDKPRLLVPPRLLMRPGEATLETLDIERTVAPLRSTVPSPTQAPAARTDETAGSARSGEVWPRRSAPFQPTRANGPNQTVQPEQPAPARVGGSIEPVPGVAPGGPTQGRASPTQFIEREPEAAIAPRRISAFERLNELSAATFAARPLRPSPDDGASGAAPERPDGKTELRPPAAVAPPPPASAAVPERHDPRPPERLRPPAASEPSRPPPPTPSRPARFESLEVPKLARDAREAAPRFAPLPPSTPARDRPRVQIGTLEVRVVQSPAPQTPPAPLAPPRAPRVRGGGENRSIARAPSLFGFGQS